MTSKGTHPSPFLHSNKWSTTFHSWLSKLIDLSHRQGTLFPNDVYDVLPEYESKEWINKLENHWLNEYKKQQKNASLFRATLRTLSWKPLLIGLFLIPARTMAILQPIFIIYLMEFFEPCSKMSILSVIFLTILNCITNLVLACAQQTYYYRIIMLGLKLRVAFQGLVYGKLLRLSSRALNQLGTGEITNLFSNDAAQIGQTLRFMNFLWAGPIEIVATVCLFWYYIKYVAFVSIGYALFIVLLGVIIGHFLIYFRTRVLEMTDQRVKTMSEIIHSMRIVKMYCWEAAFDRKIRSLRKKEIIRHAYRAVFDSIQIIISFSYISTVFLIIYTILWQTNMKFDTRFFAVACCMLYNLEITVLEVNCAMRDVVHFITAARRIRKFLLYDESERDQRLLSSSENDQTNVSSSTVHCNLIEASWNETDSFTLKNITFDAVPGDLICIIGPVGCGKSSLLQSLSGEISHFQGKIRLNGSFCYVPQEPWIFSSSIKQNILFGADFNSDLFVNVLRVTALDEDLLQFPDGVNTLVGDHGVMLSGGQKARVNMARALYRNADIYLLDDPLSAVDTKVSKHLFDKSIKEYLQEKVCILVTHQVQFLQEATQILVLDRGEVVQMGNYDDLLTSSSSFTQLLKAIDQHERTDDSQRKQSIKDDDPSDHDDETDEFIPSKHREVQQKGSVKLRVYLDYIRAGLGCLPGLLVVLLIFLCYQTSLLLFSWWLAKWSENEGHRHAVMNNCSQPMTNKIEQIRSMSETEWNRQRDRTYYIFVGIGFSMIFFSTLRTFLVKMTCLNASRVLHNKMFQRLIRTPISFFDTNPIGRIINRFTKDLSITDEDLPTSVFDFIDCFFQVLGVIALVVWLNPWSLIAATVTTSVMLYIRYRYAGCSRDLKRLVGLTRSPYYSHFTSTIHGLKVIRSYRAEQASRQEFSSHIDVNTSAEHLFETVTRWAAMRFDWSTIFFVLAVTFLAVIVRTFGQQLSSGDIALTLGYSTSLMGLTQWMIRQSVEVESLMTAVERLLEYCHLEQEPPAQLPPPYQPPTNWPFNGSIVYEHVSMSHSNDVDTSMALQNISLRIEPREKIGIVGRTGAGKTSFIQVLFRLGNVVEGKIFIDNIDILKIGLNDLRRRLSIIPQDPVLFVGTIRDNLDQFGNYSDVEIWNALEQVQLKRFVTDVMPNGLQSPITERGSNLSIGQKQLVCLARAILKKSKILVVDEATANVDNETDELIQRAIRQKFKECTVLTVAHRLRTVIDSDRIMVLDHGKLVEFDHPAVLLDNRQSHLSALVDQTGSIESEYLRVQAQKQVI